MVGACCVRKMGEFIDHKASMITDDDPLRGLLFYQDLGFSLTLHVLQERRRRCEHPHLRRKGKSYFDHHFDHHMVKH